MGERRKPTFLSKIFDLSQKITILGRMKDFHKENAGHTIGDRPMTVVDSDSFDRRMRELKREREKREAETGDRESGLTEGVHQLDEGVTAVVADTRWTVSRVQ